MSPELRLPQEGVELVSEPVTTGVLPTASFWVLCQLAW
jgi:hypothetical protein